MVSSWNTVARQLSGEWQQLCKNRLQTTFPRFLIFHGWYVLVACFSLLFFQAGARFSFGIMFKPMLTQLGWDRASISLVFFLNMISFASTLSIAGNLHDRWGPKWVILISTFYISAVLFGFAFLITAPLKTTLVGKLYGFARIRLISGFITMIHHLGGGFWAYIGGFSYDHSGSYNGTFILSGILAGVAMICSLMIKEKSYAR